MRPKIIVVSLIIIFQFAINTVIGAAWVLPRNSMVIPAGVSVNGIDVGGLTQDQAISYLKQKFPNAVIDQEIVLSDAQKNWIIKTSDYNFIYDYAGTIDEVFKSINWVNNSSRVINTMKLQAQDMDFPLQISWDEEQFLNSLDTINEQLLVPAQDASLDYKGGRFVIKLEKTGQGMDVDLIKDRIINAVKSGETEPIILVRKEVAPRVLSKNLEKIDCELAVFSTSLGYSTSNRSHNILLAAQMLNNSLIMPGDTFSFNEQVGQRNQEKGYTTAPIIVGNTLKDDIGGGVCQVASTFYNASLTAGLEIVEHTNHSIPVKYVPPGKDATVYYDQVDLKIKNSLGNPILIKSYIEKNSLIVKLLGSTSDKKSLK